MTNGFKMYGITVSAFIIFFCASLKGGLASLKERISSSLGKFFLLRVDLIFKGEANGSHREVVLNGFISFSGQMQVKTLYLST